jgi:hypothetical protein
MWSNSFITYMVQLQYKKEKGIEALNALIGELELRGESSLWVMGQCDAIIASTKPLADYIRLIVNKPVLIVENAIDVQAFIGSMDVEKQLVHPHFVTVGWAGGSRPLKELDPMLTAWNVLATNSKIKFVISGWMPNLEDYTLLTKENVIHVPWADLNSYANGMQVDIGCVCVGDSDFSRRKSVIKAWEYALADALVVGSKSLYEREPIVWCENSSDWYKILKWYTNNLEEREKLAQTYKKFVIGQYDIQFNWLYWADAYQKIMNLSSKAKDNNERSTVQV